MWLSNFGAMIPLNILHGTLLLMLVPYGIASVGMTRVSIDITKRHYYTSITDYFLAISKCWKQALIAGIINLFVTVILAISVWIYYAASGMVATIGLFLSAIALMIFSFMKYYVWTQIVLIDLPLKQIYKNSYYFAFLNFKKNAIIGTISLIFYAIAVLALLYIPYPVLSVALILLAGCFFPGFKQLLVQWYVYPFIKKNMIDPYYNERNENKAEESDRASNASVEGVSQ